MTVKVDSSLLNDNFSRTYITNDKFLQLERQLCRSSCNDNFLWNDFQRQILK